MSANALICRMLWQNFAISGSAVLGASSANVSYPIRRLRDPLRSARWRSKTGWTVVAGWNDEIDFTEGTTGDATATLTAGTYATGDDMAAEIQTAINAAATDNTYTVTYSASTFKFTIARATGAATFGLEWLTGGSVQSAGVDLGFDVSADDTGATTYTGGLASYQSRHYVTVDLGSIQDIGAAALVGHTSGSSGTWTIQAAAVEADALLDPDFTQELNNTTRKDVIRAAVFAATEQYRYWALIINNVQGTDGFTGLGVLYLGSWLTLDLPARGLDKDPEDFSNVSYADQGAHFQDRKQRTRRWGYKFEALTEAQVDEIDTALSEVLTGGSFFFQRDPDADAGDIRYVFFPQLPKIGQTAGADRWSVDFEIQEALG